MFPPEARRIFGPFCNGESQVYADPIRVYRRLHFALDGDPNKYLRDRRSEDQEVAFKAKEHLISAAVYAFEMKPFDPTTGQGVLEENVLPTLKAYLEYMDAKKEMGLNSQTSSPPILAFTPQSQMGSPSTMTPTSPYGVISGDCGCKKRGR